jgi:hypothetical protein
MLPKTLTYNPSIHKTLEDLTDLSKEIALEYREVSRSIDWESIKPFQENKKNYCEELLKEADVIEDAYATMVCASDQLNMTDIRAGL